VPVNMGIGGRAGQWIEGFSAPPSQTKGVNSHARPESIYRRDGGGGGGGKRRREVGPSTPLKVTVYEYQKAGRLGMRASHTQFSFFR